VVTCINHITFAVRDLARSFAFYADLLGLQPVARWSAGCYLTAGSMWITLIVDSATRDAPLPEYTHVAFAVRAEHLSALALRLKQAGVQEWQANQTEGESFYFLDPDGYKLELRVGSLADRLQADHAAGWPDFVFFDDEDAIQKG
jgi:catechol 2,3-dioxygenase-like lactoylglutathione lyase family enzyme